MNNDHRVYTVLSIQYSVRRSPAATSGEAQEKQQAMLPSASVLGSGITLAST